MNILIVIEDNNGAIHKMSLEAIVAAQEISSKLNAKTTALVMGRNAEALALEASKYELNDILKINSSSLNSYSSDGLQSYCKQCHKKKISDSNSVGSWSNLRA